jgi:hypothetical protein
MSRDYDSEILGAEQQRKTAQLLRERATKAPDGSMISGWYVQPSWSQYLSQALNQYLANDSEKKATQTQKDSQTAKSEELAGLLRGYGTKTEQPINTNAANPPSVGSLTDNVIQGYQPSKQVPLDNNEQLAQDVRLQQLSPYAAGFIDKRTTREETRQDKKDALNQNQQFQSSQAESNRQAKVESDVRHAELMKALQTQKPTNWSTVQTDNGIVQVNPTTGEVRPLGVNAPVKGNGANSSTQHIADAKESNALLDQVEKIGDTATGSRLGNVRDAIAGTFGQATNGAKGAAQMKVLGASLTAKVPKMSGPQSDKDVAMYKEAAGNVSDPNTPWELKKAAIQVIREINNRQLGYGNDISQNTKPSGGGATFLGFE